LLGFQLLPRLKAISAQRLYLPEAGSDAHPHLVCILTRAIDWALVEQQYDEMARYATDGRTDGRPRDDSAALHPCQPPAPISPT
jgi:TnpA family transposase